MDFSEQYWYWRMSTRATWSRVVQSREVSHHNFDGLAMSVLVISASPYWPISLDLPPVICLVESPIKTIQSQSLS